MSERGRSKLFGRPGELLVDEAPPRILMPSPPPPRPAVEDDRTEDTRPGFAAADEEQSLPSGPLRVFVGPPLRPGPPDVGPIPADTTPGRSLVPPRPGDTLPGALMTDAVGELGDILGRRIPAARQSSRPISSSDPFRTDLPDGLRGRSLPPEDPFRTELPPFDFLGSTPPRAPAASAPTPERGGRPQGIPTAAARVRARPVVPELEEETRIDASPLQILDGPRGAREAAADVLRDPLGSDAPRWDDPRFRKPDASEISGITAARIPPRAPELDRKEPTEPTNPGVAARSSEEPAAPARAATPPPPAAKPVPPPRLTTRAPGRPRVILIGGLIAALALGAVAWQWNLRTRAGGPRTARPAAAAPAVPPTPPPAPDAAPAPVAAPSVDAPALPAEASGDAPPIDPASTLAVASPVSTAEAATPAGPSAPSEASVSGGTAPAMPATTTGASTPASATPAGSASAATAAPATRAGTAPAGEPSAPPAGTPKAPDQPSGSSSAAVPATGTSNAAVDSVVTDRRGGYLQPMGLLQVVCNRTATIYVDDVRKGTTAEGRPIELAAGTHRVRIVAGGYSRTQVVRVDAGQLRMVEFRMR